MTPMPVTTRKRYAAAADGAGHTLGLGLVAASALAFSLAGTLTKLITAGAWTIAGWRGLIGGVLIVIYVAWMGRRKRGRETFELGWRGWFLSVVASLASILFIYAFKLTYVANVAVIYATAPFMAAGLGCLLIGERSSPQTLIAALFSLAGVAVVMAGGVRVGGLVGELVALAMTFGCALYMVLVRAYRNTPVVLAVGVSSLQLFVIAWLIADPLAVSRNDITPLLLFGVSFAVATVLWTEGTKRITAAESGFLGTAETPFAILLAWLILGELPPLASFIGGAVVLGAVVVNILFRAEPPHNG